MKNTGMDKGCEKIKAIKSKKRVKSITAHMTSDAYDFATLAADAHQITDSRFGAVAISVVSKLVLMRVEYGWRRVLKRQWWKILKGIL